MHGASVGVIAACLVLGGVGMGDAAPSRHVQAALVAEKDAVQPGQPLVVGVRLRMDPGWHTYWRNPGDAGLPTRAKWSLPEGFQAGDLQWPRPGRFNTGPLVSFGYEHEVLLPVEIEVPATVRSKDVTLRAKVSWLECEDICLPGKAELALTLPVRPQAAPGPAAKLFETAREQMPTSDHGWGFGTSVDPGTITLKVTPPAGATLSEAYFYAITKRVLDYSPSQELRAAGGRQELVLPRKANAGPGDRLEGVLVGRSTRGPVAIEVSVPLGGGR